MSICDKIRKEETEALAYVTNDEYEKAVKELSPEELEKNYIVSSGGVRKRDIMDITDEDLDLYLKYEQVKAIRETERNTRTIKNIIVFSFIFGIISTFILNIN